MRLGVIDVGSNTVHMLVVDAVVGGHPLPAHSHKIDLRLAENVEADGSITAAGAQRLFDFFVECQRIRENRGLAQIYAFATSAMRDAPNSDDVVARIEAATGIHMNILEGPEEARMTFLAVRRWFGWSSGKVALFDIGGGSLEMAVGIDEEPDAAISMPLGAGRLYRDFLAHDPATPEEIRALRTHARATIAKSIRPLVKAFPADRCVASSKTFRSLSRIAGAAPSGAGPYVPRSLKRSQLTDIVTRLSPMTIAERVGLPGVSASRAPQLLAGAITAEAALELLDVDHVDICPWALREGVILRQLDHLDDD